MDGDETPSRVAPLGISSSNFYVRSLNVVSPFADVHRYDLEYGIDGDVAVAVWHDPQLDLVDDGAVVFDRELAAQLDEPRRLAIRLIAVGALFGVLLGLLFSGALPIGG